MEDSSAAECGNNFADFAPGYTIGPHGQSLDSIMSTCAQFNGAFSERAWAEARQNGNAAPSIEKLLPSWPPSEAHSGFGHTYPVQSKHGETVLGSKLRATDESMNTGHGCKESGTLPPLFINPKKSASSGAAAAASSRQNAVFDKNLREPYDVWDKYSATDVPRVNGTLAAREYDMALDIADKISRGATLTSTFYTMPGRDGGCGEPVSYAQQGDMTMYSSSNTMDEQNTESKVDKSRKTNKRLTNLLVADREYGASATGKKNVIMKVTSSVDESEGKKKTDKSSSKIGKHGGGILDKMSAALVDFRDDAGRLQEVLVKYDGSVSKTAEHLLTHNGRGAGIAYSAVTILLAVILIVAVIYAMKK